MGVWRQILRPGDLFIDVGANIGSYSIWAADMGAEVVALEPAQDTFELLVENINLNGYVTIEAIQAAAGEKQGTARFTSGADCVNHLDPGGPVEVAMTTLDDVIGLRTAAGLKVDVEGFELAVLRGAERALREGRIRLIQLEWNQTSYNATGQDRSPVAALLTGYGYTLHRPDPTGRLLPIDDHGYGADVFASAP